ncbi:putative structural maintenance of chromosomes protein 3 isoform X3 [Apostichopus japonicus]|uniref:Putative structural maintenance of chromosomes protein 3 isoform X3 n=1 Tax=Stichopus japonicus TaxID=307972 RepID=A0A2G8LNY5_STIJA|nr:putative structural maintenance of chromosomes protein 3 isoform X3 [Apostichopus japonicus]
MMSQHLPCHRAVLRGIDSIKQILDGFRKQGEQQDVITGYHGILIENFQCASRFNTCVEVTAGSRLFYHIVNDDLISTKILSEMNRSKMPGEVTFMPLNRLEVRDQRYPESPDALPMVSNLQYEKKFDKVFKHVFGKTLICRSIEVATQFSRTQDLDCVTLEGDQVSRRGAITGGYYDTRKSRLELQSSIVELRERLTSQEQQYEELRDKLQKVEVEITSMMSDMQKIETKNRKNKNIYEKMRSDMRIMKGESNVIEKALGPKEKRVQSLLSNLEAMKGSARSLEDELGTDLLSQLSVQDQREVDRLNDEIKGLNLQNKKALNERIKLEGDKNKKENVLSGNLMRKREQMIQELSDISVEDRRQKLDNSSMELQTAETAIDSNKARMEDIESQIESLNREQQSKQVDLEEWKGKEKEYCDKIGDDAKVLEKMTNKQSLLLKKKEECMRKIRELGSLPSDAFEKYTHLSLKQLFKKLDQCNAELKKYSHVNKKALDQFINFSDQKEKLIKRKEESDKGHSSITDLMNVLELRKYEAIQFTFKQVSKYFSEVFSKLVPVEGNPCDEEGRR